MILFISHFKKIHSVIVCGIFWWKARVKAERPIRKFLQKCHFTQELMTYQSHALPIFVSPTTYRPGSVTAKVYWLKHTYQEKWASFDFYGIILNDLSRLYVIKFSKLYNFVSYKEPVLSPIHQGIDSIFWQQVIHFDTFFLLIFIVSYWSRIIICLLFIQENQKWSFIVSANSTNYTQTNWPVIKYNNINCLLWSAY